MLFGSPVSSFVSFRFTVSTTPALRLPTTFLSRGCWPTVLGERPEFKCHWDVEQIFTSGMFSKGWEYVADGH